MRNILLVMLVLVMLVDGIHARGRGGWGSYSLTQNMLKHNLRVSLLNFPASARRRFDVDTTLFKRSNNVMCLLGNLCLFACYI